MAKFLAGFAAAIVVVVVAALSYVRLGLFDPRADKELARSKASLRCRHLTQP